jgi:hypothetical protein
MEDRYFRLMIGVLVVVGVGLLAWRYWDDMFPPPAPEPPASLPAAEEPVADTGPKHPLPQPESLRAPDGELVPLPPLDDSDSYFLLEIENTLGDAVEALLVREDVIDRLVTSIDNLPRGKIPDRIRPVGTLDEPFEPDAGDGDTPMLGTTSFARYDALVAYIYYADVDTVFDIYQRFYPLFQTAYERLGYPDAYFNDRLIEVIDHLLATPVPAGPLELKRPNVLYEFADPDLEALSSGQKLLLRMGPDNASTLKRKLEKFRERLAAN